MTDHTLNNELIPGTSGYESFFDLNRSLDEGSFYLNEVENAIDSLETAVTFLQRNDNLKWKWVAFALHHSLYSFCIACLVNGNYENVLSGGKNDDQDHFCLMGNDVKWRKSRRIKRPNSGGYTIEWSYTDEEPRINPARTAESLRKQNLIGFWTALARVQDQVFWMGRMVHTKPLVLSEDEWQSIEWLTNQVRNGCVHFVPKNLAVSIPSVKKASLDILRAIEFLALESYAILYTNHKQAQERVKVALMTFRSRITT
ncbi:MAG TPA: hypothetical protein VNI77_01950 [Nitrososphaera sp.]|nr:hypothetical protein [Nitrososphaera sp.]